MEGERRPRREVFLPAWLSLAGAALVGGMLVFLGWEMHRAASEQPAPQPWVAKPEEVAQFAPLDGRVPHQPPDKQVARVEQVEPDPWSTRASDTSRWARVVEHALIRRCDACCCRYCARMSYALHPFST